MDKNTRKMRGSREPRDVTIETYSGPNERPSPLLAQSSQSSRTSSKSHSTSRENSEEKSCMSGAASNIDDSALGAAAVCNSSADQINFISGNPYVEVTKGILHLFKEK